MSFAYLHLKRLAIAPAIPTRALVSPLPEFSSIGITASYIAFREVPSGIQVLRLLETFGFEDLHAAVKHALRLGAVSFDAVKHLLLCQIEKRPPKLDLDIYPYLPRATVATTSPASYMSLMTEGQS